jgi:DNA-binding MarR family transcriptional regulator
MARAKKKRSALTELGLAARASRTALSEKLAVLDLYPGQDAVLQVLAESDGMALRELADRLAVRPPTITKTIARLAAQGHLEKRASAVDARQSHAFLTERGRGAVDAVRDAQKSVERQALAGFTPKERKALRRLLARVGENLGEAAAAPDEEAPAEAALADAEA